MVQIIPVFKTGLRIDGLFKCCDKLHYTPNRFNHSDCPICKKRILLSNKLMFEILNNLEKEEV